MEAYGLWLDRGRCDLGKVVWRVYIEVYVRGSGCWLTARLFAALRCIGDIRAVNHKGEVSKKRVRKDKEKDEDEM